MTRLLALLLFLPTLAWGQVPISALPSATTLTGSELVPIVQGGVTKKATVSLISPLQSVRAFGAKCDGSTNDTAAIQAAFNASSWVIIPGAQCRFTLLTVTHPLRVSGATAADGTTGGSELRSTDTGTSNKITIGNGVTQLNGVTFEHLAMSAPSSIGGAMVFFNYTGDSGLSDVQMFSLNSTAHGVLAYQNNGIRFDHVRINLPTTSCWRFYSGAGSSGRTDDMEIDNSICLGDSLTAQTHMPNAIDLDGNVNTLVGSHINVVSAGRGIWQHNSVGATDKGAFIVLHDFETDFPYYQGILIDSGEGDYFSNVYVQGAATQAGVQINYNATQTTGDISFTGGKIANSRISPNVVINGTGVRIVGVNISGGGINATGTVPGVQLGAHAQDVVITGNIIGSIAGLVGATQTYGVQIDAGATNYLVNDNDLEGNATGTFIDNSGAPNISAGMTTNNLGAVTPTSNGSSIPLTGFTLNLGTSGSSPLPYANYAIFPGGTLATGTFLFPVHPYNTEALSIYSSQTVTALTLTPGSGDVISPTLTTIAAGHTLTFIYNLANHTWVQFGG